MVLRVCLVSPLPPPYGGMSHWTQMLKGHANQSGTNVELRVLDTAPKWRAIHDVMIWKRVLGGAFQLIRDLLAFIVLLLSWRPDAVHVATSGQLALIRDVFILAMLRVVKVQAVYHLHFGRVPDVFLQKGIESFLLRMASTLATHIIAIDKRTYCVLVDACGAHKVSLVPNFYDQTKIPTPVRCQSKKVMFLGWVTHAKGIEELIAAWGKCLTQDWTLSIVGPCEDEYMAFLKSQYSSNGIEFLGEMKHDDAMVAMNEASIFVLPSHTEGFPNVVLEAMAMGKAIVATDVGAIPEMLGSDRGILVPKCNVEKLANALKTAMDDESLRERLGQSAESFAQSHYSINAVFQMYRELWQSDRYVAG